MLPDPCSAHILAYLALLRLEGFKRYRNAEQAANIHALKANQTSHKHWVG
jgi:hypothetical protein